MSAPVKLTAAQLWVLEEMAEEARVRIRVEDARHVCALEAIGLLRLDDSLSPPAYEITDAGRAALAASKEPK